ncbi:MAG: permease of the drug/metabolite transporter superfamily [Rhizorhabdus sp.]|nr:permease of the drug/metabolite transporter superfamily [Rhizorhabdus sp.]
MTESTHVNRLAWVALPISVSAYQILAKSIADHALHATTWPIWLWHIATSPVFLLLVAAEIGSFGLWMYILARVRLSAAFPLSAGSYIIVLIASWTMFGETGNIVDIMGIAAILAGIYFIGRSEGPADGTVAD